MQFHGWAMPNRGALMPTREQARVAGEAGYTANYYRYFGVPQDPFGWHFQVISAMTDVSVAAPFMRLPAFLLGLLGWWLISREVIPRLGRAVRHSTPAVWSAAFVFLAIWLPFNNGLRPEPAEAVGALRMALHVR